MLALIWSGVMDGFLGAGTFGGSVSSISVLSNFIRPITSPVSITNSPVSGLNFSTQN
ncbi:MAG: hypothetical protein QNJ68_17195 [Microcoleaceae cyanobacterium MO_207.B10]|nr:hypothetical protein [Microcoleaceae cyanobacterium MO_207.B10]